MPGSDWIEWGSGSTGWLYKYEMRGVQTEIIGGEVQMGYKGNTIDITSDFSFVRGKNISDNDNIAFIPPDKIGLLISTKSNNDLTGSVRINKVLDQKKISEFETITPGYMLIDVFGSYTFGATNGTHRLVFQINNVLNETYYNHLSKIKSIMPESGRSISLQYRILL